MVVYQAMYPPYGVWVRPLDMFMERVDRQTYPDAKTEYRFERITIGESATCQRIENGTGSAGIVFSQKGVEQKAGDNIMYSQEIVEKTAVSEKELKEAVLSMHVADKMAGRLTHNQIAQQGFMAILDASSNREKRQLMMGLKEYMDNRILSNIAVALDITLEDGTEEEHFDTIMHCLETFEKFEGGRLRR